MVVNDEINVINNQPEVVQPLEAVKSHLISDEENSTNSNDNQLEAIVPIGIVNSPKIPCVSNNDNCSSPGSIDPPKLTTYHQSQITPQISCSSKDELTRNAKTASLFEPHTCEDYIKKRCRNRQSQETDYQSRIS